MIEALDFVDELLDIAKDPERFSKPEMGEMILVAATEIIKLRSLNEIRQHGAPKDIQSIGRTGRRRLTRARASHASG